MDTADVPALWPQVLSVIPTWRGIELDIRGHFAIERDWHKHIIRAIGWKSKEARPNPANQIPESPSGGWKK